MVSLVPSFSLADQKVELIFLVDRSGSMGQGYDYQKNEPTEGSIGELCEHILNDKNHFTVV